MSQRTVGLLILIGAVLSGMGIGIGLAGRNFGCQIQIGSDRRMQGLPATGPDTGPYAPAPGRRD